MPPKTPPAAAAAPMTFEKGLEQLEQIVRDLERGDLALEESIALFERGVALTETCRKQLEDAETRVEILRTQSVTKLADASVPEETADDRASGANNDEDVPF
ncbi:MAG: exodeoxyribonuclease VII small subunit [Bryobacterales bacterium]|nr:exodeoxyribonuclease VII small subunit [Bryobacterales bacterium]